AEQPTADGPLPGVGLVALLLLLGGLLNQLRGVQPPGLFLAVAHYRLGPNLIAIKVQLDQANFGAALHRPETPAAGFVFQIVVEVDRAPEYALARGIDEVSAVGRPDVIGAPREKGFDFADLGSVHGVQLG